MLVFIKSGTNFNIFLGLKRKLTEKNVKNCQGWQHYYLSCGFIFKIFLCYHIPVKAGNFDNDS